MTDEPLAPPARRRRGLTLPPKGQALTRLQDLEGADPAPAPSGATEPAGDAEPADDTASSNAVRNAVPNAVSTAGPQNGSPNGGGSVPATRAPAVKSASHAAAAARLTREPTTRITVDMPDSLHRQISLLSVETRRSIKDLVIAALEATYFTPAEDRPAQ